MKRNYIFAAALLAATAAPAPAATDATGAADSVGLGEGVVTGTRGATDIRHLPMTVSVVGRQKLTESYRTQVLPTISEQVPGLFVTSRGVLGYGVSNGSAGSIKVRGVGSGASMLVLIDGVPQYAGLMGHPIPDAYQTMLADRVEVLRGPASLLYGSNAMGGVVNIVTRQLRRDGSRNNVTLQGGSYGTIEGGITNTTRKGRVESILGFNYSHTDGDRPDSRFSQYSGFAKLGYEISSHWRATGDINLTHFEAENPGEVESPLTDNDSRITRGMASLALTNTYRNTEGAVRVFYNWGHHEINDGYGPGEEPQEALYMHDDLMGGVSIYQSASFFRGNRITLGFDYQHFGGRAWNEEMATKAESVLGDKEQDEVAGYAELRQDLWSWLTIDAGLRVDHHSQSGTELVPQGGLTFRLSPQADLKQPHYTRDVHVPARQRPVGTRAAGELRAGLLAPAAAQPPAPRRQRVLPQGGEHHRDRAHRRPPAQHKHGRDRELGRGNRRCLRRDRPPEAQRQLQFPRHEPPRDGRAGAQALPRG